MFGTKKQLPPSGFNVKGMFGTKKQLPPSGFNVNSRVKPVVLNRKNINPCKK